MSKVLPFAFALCAGLAADASAGITSFSISELLVNPPGADQGAEGIEIRGPASAALTGYSILLIEGDGTGAGLVDKIIDLNTLSTGSNGLLLLRDTSAVLLPAPDVNTSVFVNDFVPDIENGSNSYILGFGTPPALNSDLDSDNDGTLDVGALAGFTVVDAVAFIENDGAANVGYADDVGGENLGPYSYTPDMAIRVYNADGPCSWISGDVLGTAPGPFALDLTENTGVTAQGADPSTITVTLGSLNAVYDADNDGLANGCDGCPNDGAKATAGNCGCGIPEGCSFGRDVEVLSATTGGQQQLFLFGGAANAGRSYFVLGSVTGTTPGLTFNPQAHLPLNYDFYLEFTLGNPNTLITNSMGVLDGSGNATAVFNLPQVSIPLQVTVNHAYLLIDGGNSVDFASNAVPVVLEP